MSVLGAVRVACNIRELMNVISHVLTFSDGEIIDLRRTKARARAGSAHRAARFARFNGHTSRLKGRQVEQLLEREPEARVRSARGAPRVRRQRPAARLCSVGLRDRKIHRAPREEGSARRRQRADGSPRGDLTRCITGSRSRSRTLDRLISVAVRRQKCNPLAIGMRHEAVRLRSASARLAACM